MKYDVIVIGSGPGGYVAAIRCAQLGMKTAIIEKYKTLGGTCLNVGCIPSKALLDSSEHAHRAEKDFKEHGIEIKEMKINFNQMIKRKNDVVKQTCAGVAYLMKKNKIDVYTGHGSFIDKNTVEVNPETGQKTTVETARAIIATGSKPASLPGIAVDKKRIITSTEALSLNEIPGTIVIIGGGIIGVELGSVYARLGSKVTVLEFFDSLISTMDKGLGKELEKSLRKLNMDIRLSHKVTGAVVKGNSVTVTAQDMEGQPSAFSGDYCIMAVGRNPYTQNLGCEKVGIRVDAKGKITVNDRLETTVPGIFAIGDVIAGPMLAHKAEDEGMFVAESIAGQKPHINYLAIPSVVYTHPEVAGVGYTEEQLTSANKKYKAGIFPFKASGRARASMDTDGFVKVLADAGTDEILGVHIIGPRASDMIAEAVVAMEFRASAEDIARICHAHPTYTEAIREACLDAAGKRAIHI